MSVIISVIILILAMLISAFLQLVPGTFSIFYHFSLSKTNAKKADDRSLGFILGSELFITFIWVAIYSLILSFFCNSPDFCPSSFFWIMSGILFAEAVAVFWFYYRKSKATALFIPRRTASTISNCARKAKSRSDAITLGFFAGLPELIFTLPLYVISAIILLNTTAISRALVVILYVLFSTIPLFIIRTAYRTGHNLADITRARTRFKPFFRLSLSILYVLLALAVLNLGIINYG